MRDPEKSRDVRTEDLKKVDAARKMTWSIRLIVPLTSRILQLWRCMSQASSKTRSILKDKAIAF